MKLNEDANPGVNLIRGYAPGEISVAGQRLVLPCVVAAQQIVSAWTASFEQFGLADLQVIWDLGPQIVLLGTGARQRFPPAEIRNAFASRRIALEPMDLGAACRTYNVLVQEDRAVVAALFP